MQATLTDAMKNVIFRRVLLIVAMAGGPLSALAGPFGLEQGMRLSDLGELTESVVPGKYILDTVPNPNPAFKEYVVQVGAQTGLCWIKAISENIPTNPYGAELKTAFTKMENIVEGLYGNYRLIDGVVLGSVWEEPAEWMQALLNEERLLAAFWDLQSGSILPDDLNAIDLTAAPTSQNSGYIAIEYSFKNSSDCESAWVATAEENTP